MVKEPYRLRLLGGGRGGVLSRAAYNIGWRDMPSAVSSLELWRDNRGRLSVLRVLTLALMLWPIALAIYAWQTEIRFSARPVNDLIHRAGFWMLMFVLASLTITPLRRIARYGGLVDVRRMLGVGAFCYGVAHLSLYALDQM